MVRGLKAGIVRITATDQKGFKITRTMAVFDVSFDGPESIRVGESALIKLNAEPYDGRKHLLSGLKSGSSGNNDLKIRVFYCEKGGNNWKEAEVKRVAL